ncbi:MAG: hypothetical protein RMJ98_13250 [Myxococcales bacterium]|nr:hypothetical protein [Polyangiaceae bacterium]MDW8250255.1 hypothetical protein [Myxococcales bacterium]
MPCKRPAPILSGVLLGVVLLACERPGDDIGPDFEQIPSAHIPIALPSQLTPSRVLGPAPASGSAATMASAPTPAMASASTHAAAATSASSSAAPKLPAKVFDCGDKGKPDCPMQKWMKSVAGGAVASGDTERLARAFLAMSKAPPGFSDWAAICAAGAAKAQAGDFDGAKAQCKVCHTKYQARYHATMRDLKWP